MKNPTVGRRRWKGSVVALVVVLAMVMAACGNQSSDTTAGGTETTSGGQATTTTSGGSATTSGSTSGTKKLVVGISVDHQGLDPVRIGTTDKGPALEGIFQALTERGIPFQSSGDIQPAVATSIESNDDSTVWTIKIRDDVKWQNGEPLTAEDVAYSFNIYTTEDGKSLSGYGFYPTVKEAVVIDPTTVEVRLTEPTATFYLNSPRAYLVPEKYYETDEWQAKPIAAGPYKIVDYRPDDVLQLEAFDDYFMGKPAIDQIDFRVIPDDAARVAALQAGDVDLIFPTPVESLQTIEDDPDLRVDTSDSLTRFFVEFDTTQPPFDDIKVRMAASHAVDRQGIIDGLLGGLATVMPAHIIPGVEPGHNPDLEPISYDPDLSRQLLAEAGYPNGLDEEQELSCRGTGTAPEDVCTAIAAMLTDVGIPTVPRVYESNDFTERSAAGTLGGKLHYFNNGGGGSFFGHEPLRSEAVCRDSATPLQPSNNWGGYYCNPAFDEALWNATQLLTSDYDGAIEYLQQAETILYDDYLNIDLWVMKNAFGVREGLNWSPPARYDFNFFGATVDW